jgi:hypothetical protein
MNAGTTKATSTISFGRSNLMIGGGDCFDRSSIFHDYFCYWERRSPLVSQ